MTVHDTPRGIAPRKLGSASDSGTLGGRPPRIEGIDKTRGGVPFAYDQRLDGMVHAVLVGAGIAGGRILRFDTAAAEAAPGVLAVYHADNCAPLHGASDFLGNPPAEPEFHAFPRQVIYAGQPVALVVAESFEQATEAARLVKLDYEAGEVWPDMHHAPESARVPLPPTRKSVGDAEAVLAAAPVTVEAEYLLPREYQAAIEPQGLTAVWEGDRLTLHEPNQWPDGAARSYSEWFGIPFENVRIVSPYIGGGFGGKGFVQPYCAMTAIAARKLGRPVRTVLTRAQTFSMVGGRAATRQKLMLGADRDGRILAIRQEGASEAPRAGMWAEQVGVVTQMMYRYDAFQSAQVAIRANVVCPGAKRAPGENPSAHGIECAIDELAYAVGVDPLEIRLRNYAEEDPFVRKPWSTRQLREAFAAGAERFGWSGRSPEPRSMREGSQLIGWGVAAGTYPVRRAAGESRVEVFADGTAEVTSSSTDMGQGAYTIIAQTAAEILGLPVEAVRVRLGDSALPRAGVTGGSRMAMTMTAATHKAGGALKEELIQLALSDPASPFAGQANTLSLEAGRISLPDGSYAIPIGEFLAAVGRDSLAVTRDTMAEFGLGPERAYDNYTTVGLALPPTEGDFSHHSWCAHFVEVRVDEDFGTVRVSRVVSAMDSGRIFNPKLAESQWKGGIIMGIGQALLEQGVFDPRHARMVNDSFGDYLIPTQADIPEIEVISVGIPDTHASPLGGKGVGELGIVGVAPAIANAVFHATGKRIRSLPITLEQLL